MAENNALAAFTPGGAPAPAPASGPPNVRQVAPNVAMTDFNDESVRKYEFDLYSGESGKIDRIHILRPDSIAKGRSHYHDKLKGGILCQSVYTLSADGKQETLVEERNCCKWLGSSNTRFAALIIQYNTQPNGEFARPFGYALKVWRFGADKFIQLRNINKDFPLSKFDLSVYCTDKQYQKMQIGAKPDCVLLNPNFPANVKGTIEAWANASVTKLPRELGKTPPNDAALFQELQQAGIIVGGMPPGVAGAGPVPGPTMAGDAPVANFDDIIATAVPTPGQ